MTVHLKGKIKMSAITRREAREELLGLLFEAEFRPDEDFREVYAIALEERELPIDDYIKRAFFSIGENKEEIDNIIGENSHGWKTHRLSKLSRSVLRLCVNEMLYEKDIPYSVSINEAVELSKKFDDEKARPFVNGVLNSVKKQLEAAEDGNENG